MAADIEVIKEDLFELVGTRLEEMKAEKEIEVANKIMKKMHYEILELFLEFLKTEASVSFAAGSVTGTIKDDGGAPIEGYNFADGTAIDGTIE